MTRDYQPDFSLMYESMNSQEGRRKKAATMLAVLADVLGGRLTSAKVLNLGCSTGIIDEFLAGHVAWVTGVDIDEPAIKLATSRRSAPNVEFRIDDAMQLSLADASVDVVICSQVYEHVPDPRRMMDEIHRVLRSGGVCYFAATNRWAVIEKHHRLPFLSWLPGKWADRYIRLAGRGDAYYERHLGYRPLLDLVSRFRVEEFTGKILAEPHRYSAEYLFPGALARWAAKAMFITARPLFPGYIWLLWKN